ncbi:MAG: hypothetical protein MI922_16245, partial [Bacteroidales bacterium]|nr:hypothetical protein [Bacteroidales bacterium]
MKILKNKILLSGLVVAIVIIIPSFIFSIYEYGTITDEEKMVKDISGNELNSILFSVNDHASNEVIIWQKTITSALQDDNSYEIIDDYFRSNELLQQLHIMHLETIMPQFSLFKDEHTNKEISEITNYFVKNDSVINQLKKFLTNGYQQI